MTEAHKERPLVKEEREVLMGFRHHRTRSLLKEAPTAMAVFRKQKTSDVQRWEPPWPSSLIKSWQVWNSNAQKREITQAPPARKSKRLRKTARR